jgi:hypothetical protein
MREHRRSGGEVMSMSMRYLFALALVAVLLPACSSHVDSSADNSAAAPSPAGSSDPVTANVPAFQKMEAAIDNNFADIVTDKKDGSAATTSVGFYPQYPCTVGTNGDKSMYWGYCFLGVTSSRADADADYETARKIIAQGDPTLSPGLPPLSSTKSIVQSQFQNDTHAVYLFEQQQDNGKYVVKMTFAKPSALK